MTDEEYTRLLEEARDIRYVIYVTGGNATKTVIENVLMARNPGLGRGDAHMVTNSVEGRDLDPFPRQRVFTGREAPTMADYPEIAAAGVRYYRQERKEG